MDQAKRRILGHYDFEDGSVVEIWCSGSIETTIALDMVEILANLKREELSKKNRRGDR